MVDIPFVSANCIRVSANRLRADSRRPRHAGPAQRELAERAGISKTALCAIETGRSDAKGSTLRAIQRVLEAAGARFIDDNGVIVK
jgi:predicted transcriptional regulator